MTPFEKVEQIARLVSPAGRFYIQRWDDGDYGCGVGGLGEFDVRDKPTVEAAVDELGEKVARWLWTQINAGRAEQARLTNAARTLERLGY